MLHVSNVGTKEITMTVSPVRLCTKSTKTDEREIVRRHVTVEHVDTVRTDIARAVPGPTNGIAVELVATSVVSGDEKFE
jgi:hypothetical protein